MKKKKKIPKLEEVKERVTKTTHVIKFIEGEYIAHQYAKRLFKGKEQALLFVTPKENEDVEPIPIFGYFLKEDLQNIDLTKTIAPISVRIGGNHPTTTNWKDRYTIIASTQVEDNVNKYILLYM